MSYQAGEADLLAMLRLLDDYDQDNSSRANYRIINSGLSDRYAILRPGAYTVESMSLGGLGQTDYTEHTVWTTVIELFTRYKEDGTTVVLLQELVSDIKEQVAKYRQANSSSTILDIQVTGGDEMRMMPADAPQWLIWEVNCEWTEESSVTGSE